MLSQSYFSSKRQQTHYKVNKTNSLGLLLAFISEISFLSSVFRASLAAASIGSAAYSTLSASTFISRISDAFSFT
jgi:hypothetical protein